MLKLVAIICENCRNAIEQVNKSGSLVRSGVRTFSAFVCLFVLTCRREPMIGIVSVGFKILAFFLSQRR